jgi:hypothetical protein
MSAAATAAGRSLMLHSAARPPAPGLLRFCCFKRPQWQAHANDTYLLPPPTHHLPARWRAPAVHARRRRSPCTPPPHPSPEPPPPAAALALPCIPRPLPQASLHQYSSHIASTPRTPLIRGERSRRNRNRPSPFPGPQRGLRRAHPINHSIRKTSTTALTAGAGEPGGRCWTRCKRRRAATQQRPAQRAPFCRELKRPRQVNSGDRNRSTAAGHPGR